MGRLAKLDIAFRRGDVLAFADLRLLLEAYGFVLERISGSHHIYRHPGLRRTVPITPQGKHAHRYQLRQIRVIIEDAGLALRD